MLCNGGGGGGGGGGDYADSNDMTVTTELLNCLR